MPDQQIKVVNIGASNVSIGILRGSGKAKQTAIAHGEITEIYYVIEGAATSVTGGTMTGATAVAPEGTVVTVLVGPSSTRREHRRQREPPHRTGRRHHRAVGRGALVQRD